MGMTLRSFNRLIAAGAAAVVTAVALPGCGIQNGHGDYVGVVSRFQTDGVMDSCKTWEGEIAGISNRGARSGSGSGSTMHFTVLPQDKDIAMQIQDAMDHQTPLKITFRDVVNPWPCTQGSHDIITKVEPLGVALNSPFGGKGAVADEEAPARTAAPQVIIAGQAGKKVLICTEAETATAPAATTATAASATEAAKAAALAKQLPDALRLH